MATAEQTLEQGWKAQKAGDPRTAERFYRQTLADHPSDGNAWCFLGMALHDQERYHEAVAAYEKSLALQPSTHITLNNLGNTYRLMRQLDKAVECFDKAIRLKPDYLIAFKNKATSLCWEGNVPEALAVYQQAEKIAPKDPDIHKHLGIMRLLLGDFAGGWPEYDWRWQTGEVVLPDIDVARWDGSSLDGKTILLTPEQGLGDTIQFIRYAKWLKDKYNCRVIFQCPKQLKQLLATVAGVDDWVETLNSLPPVDWFAPLLHVPNVLCQEPADFPAQVPYISADEKLVAAWREKLKPYGGLRIGIAWRGSPGHQADVFRSLPLETLTGLMRLKNIHFFSLQKGPAREELNKLAARIDVIDLGGDIDEKTGAFVETAAVMKNLDLVLACDTAIIHVAGALGVPVWALLSNVADWRWLAKGDTTPWYPTMRLFRQQKIGDWPGVIEQIETALLAEFPLVHKKTPTDYHLATSGFNRVTRTKRGLAMYNRHDKYVGRSLDLYGEYSTSEQDLFRQAVRPGWLVVEAGASSGAHTLVFSRSVGKSGHVIAFEPQRALFQVLCGNMALNSITNVECRREALGEKPGKIRVPPLDYSQEANISGLVLGGDRGDEVSVITIDSLNLPRCDFLKIDVEGLELAVLRGARKTIEKRRPILYLDNRRRENSPAIIELLHSLDYVLYWHTAPLFDANNFYQNDDNIFGGGVSVNMLCIHKSIATDIAGLRKVEGPQSDWRDSG
ncbi:MAG TPA: FkbM family methyltransferase [Pirellulaceae bacterium]|jgi:FkbM family methyltransferase